MKNNADAIIPPCEIRYTSDRSRATTGAIGSGADLGRLR